MDDDLKKRKYLILRDKLRRIASDIGELNNCLDNLSVAVENNLKINKKNPIKNTLSNVRRTAKNVKNDIYENVIPRINRKL